MEQNLICPHCRNRFIVNLSGKPGVYGPTCPMCGYNFRVKLKHPSNSYVELVDKNKRLKQIGIAVFITIIIIAVIIIASVLNGMFRTTKSGELWVFVDNKSGYTVTYELYIDGVYKCSDTIEHGGSRKYTYNVSAGNHTVELFIPGESSQSQTKYVPEGGLASVHFSIILMQWPGLKGRTL